MAALAVVLPLAGPAVASPAVASPAVGSGHGPVRVPTLRWVDCGDGFQCATARVPLDYDHPSGRAITLALSRLPAADPARRIGSLFPNPGGPGGSGVLVATDGRAAYGGSVPAEAQTRIVTARSSAETVS